MDLELHLLDLPYQSLRIVLASRHARLVAQLAEAGQQTPVLTVKKESGRHILIDGYRRVAALRTIGKDIVAAAVLPVSEVDALLLWQQQQSGIRRTALEEAWLLHELTARHDLSQTELARRMGKSQSWVSRRLGLLIALPIPVQDWLRKGELSAQAATKYLVPMARANKQDCETLTQSIGTQKISVRQMGRLYIAWKAGDSEQRRRITTEPLLFLAAEDEATMDEPADPDESLVRDIEIIGAIASRARAKLEERTAKQSLPARFLRSWQLACQGLEALQQVTEQWSHAGQ